MFLPRLRDPPRRRMAAGATGEQLVLRTALPFDPEKFPGCALRVAQTARAPCLTASVGW